jgi:hypothetical protein
MHDPALAEQAWYLIHCGLQARDVARKLHVSLPSVFELLDAHSPVAMQREEQLAKGVDGLVTRNRPGPRDRAETERRRAPAPNRQRGIRTRLITNNDNIGSAAEFSAPDPIPASWPVAANPLCIPPRPAERWRIGPKGAAAVAASLGLPESDVIAAIRASAISVRNGF